MTTMNNNNNNNNNSNSKEPSILHNVILRHKTPADYRTVEELCRRAFWNLYGPGCDEHYLTHQLRHHADYLPELSFVAELETTKEILGCIMYSQSHVIRSDNMENDQPQEQEKIPTVTFGPLWVHPDYQRLGIGRRLVDHSMVIASNSLNYKAVIILGSPHNYCGYGFENCRDYNITDKTGRYPYGQLIKILNPPDKNHPFQRRREQQETEKDDEEPRQNQNKFQFQYCPIFEELDPKEVEAFDATFPSMEKKKQFSQVEFGIMIRAYLD